MLAIGRLTMDNIVPAADLGPDEPTQVELEIIDNSIPTHTDRMDTHALEEENAIQPGKILSRNPEIEKDTYGQAQMTFETKNQKKLVTNTLAPNAMHRTGIAFGNNMADLQTRNADEESKHEIISQNLGNSINHDLNASDN